VVAGHSGQFTQGLPVNTDTHYVPHYRNNFDPLFIFVNLKKSIGTFRTTRATEWTCILFKTNSVHIATESGDLIRRCVVVAGDCLRTGEYDSNNPGQYWCIDGDTIVNRYDTRKVLDIKGEDDDDGAEICAYNFHGSDNQRWEIEFA